MVTPDPRTRLLQLTSAQGASLSGLSELIGRNSTYLQQFVRKGSPRKLVETDRRTDRKSTRLNSSHLRLSRMPSSA